MSGERKERTEWHTVVIDNDNLIRVVENYVRKGSKIYVEGQLRTRKWQDRDGNDRYTTEVYVGRFRGDIELLDRREGGSGGGDWGERSGGARGGGRAAGTAPAQDFGSGPAGAFDDMDDDVPF